MPRPADCDAVHRRARCGRTARRASSGPCPRCTRAARRRRPGYFASLCGKSDAHMKRSAPIERPSSGAVRSPGSKLIQHWRWKYSLRRERQRAASPSRSSRGTRRGGPSSARSSRRRTRARPPSARGTVRARRRRRGSTASSAGRSAGSARGACPAPSGAPTRATRPGMSASPAGWNAIGEPGLLERLPHRRVRRGGGTAGRCTRSAGRTRPSSPRSAMRRASSAARFGSCIGSAPDARRAGRAPARTTRRASRCRPGTTRTARSGSWIAAELQAEARVHHRDVDAFGVEHLHALVRRRSRPGSGLRSGGRGRSRRRPRPRCRGRRDRGRSPCGPRPGTRRSRSPRSNAGGCRGRAGRAGRSSPTGRRARRGGRRRRRSRRRSTPVRSRIRSCVT